MLLLDLREMECFSRNFNYGVLLTAVIGLRVQDDLLGEEDMPLKRMSRYEVSIISQAVLLPLGVWNIQA